MQITALYSHTFNDLLDSRSRRHSSLGTQMVKIPNDPSPIFGHFYILQITAAGQGWILSPIEATQVTGLVPNTRTASETLASGTLTYYQLSNPNAVVTLRANTTTAGGCA